MGVKTGNPRGRPKGSPNKEHPGLKDAGEFRDKLLSSINSKQIARLPAELKARLASTLVPKERPPSTDTAVRVIFSMTSLGGKCQNCGAAIGGVPEATVPAPPPATERDPRMPVGPSPVCPGLAAAPEDPAEAEQRELRKELERQLAAQREEPAEVRVNYWGERY